MATEKPEAPQAPPAWPELPPEEVPTSWPEMSRQNAASGRPETAPPSSSERGAESAWANLSTPAPWPPRDPEPVDDATEHAPTTRISAVPAAPERSPAERPERPQTERPAVHPLPADGPQEQRPGAGLGRDPSDPDRPFVTAGQISGSRTPPPERQRELWNAVFADAGDAGDDDRDRLDDSRGRPVWIYALSGSVAVGVLLALLWAFVAGPLAGSEPNAAANTAAAPSPTASAGAKAATRFPRLPRYPGQASPVLGTLTDQAAGVSLPRLGGRWRLDQRAVVQSTYGYSTRQFVRTGADERGEPVFAQLLTGPLPAKLAAGQDAQDLQAAIRQVVLDARGSLFPRPNTVRSTARQRLKNGTAVNAYALTAGESKATLVVAAVPTGGRVPAIVFMSVPGDSESLLPDVNQVVRSIKVIAGQ